MEPGAVGSLTKPIDFGIFRQEMGQRRQMCGLISVLTAYCK
jgi:hypothetical protein